jgi:hypothetical protein
LFAIQCLNISIGRHAAAEAAFLVFQAAAAGTGIIATHFHSSRFHINSQIRQIRNKMASHLTEIKCHLAPDRLRMLIYFYYDFNTQKNQPQQALKGVFLTTCCEIMVEVSGVGCQVSGSAEH